MQQLRLPDFLMTPHLGHTALIAVMNAVVDPPSIGGAVVATLVASAENTRCVYLRMHERSLIRTHARACHGTHRFDFAQLELHRPVRHLLKCEIITILTAY